MRTRPAAFSAMNTAPGPARVRAGFALAMALIGVTMAGALVAGLFFSMLEEARVSRNLTERQTALVSVEGALAQSVGALSLTTLDSLAVGASLRQMPSVSGAQIAVFAIRLDSTLFWLIGDAVSTADSRSIHRRAGLLLEMRADSSGARALHRLPDLAWSELF